MPADWTPDRLDRLARALLPLVAPRQFSLSANLHRRHLNPGQRAVVALKVRELLQPAAKERIAEAGRSAAPGRPAEKASADLRDLSSAPASQPPPPSPTSADHRKSTAQAAKAVFASPRAVEQAARVAKVAPPPHPLVPVGCRWPATAATGQGQPLILNKPNTITTTEAADHLLRSQSPPW